MTTFCIDGAFAGSQTQTGAMTHEDDPPFVETDYTVRVGTDGPLTEELSMFGGSITDVRIYDRVLSAAEILDIKQPGAGPIFWAKMDEGSGTTTVDSSPNALVLVLTNDDRYGGMDIPVWTPGVLGNALEFDEVGSYLSAPFTSAHSVVNDITIAAWIKKSNNDTGLSGYGSIAARHLTGGGWDYDFYFEGYTYDPPTYDPSVQGDADARNLWFYSNGLTEVNGGYGVPVHSTVQITDLNWHHVAVTRSRTNSLTTFYVDGMFAGSGYQTGMMVHPYPNTATIPDEPELNIITVGSDLPEGDEYSHFGGKLDDVRIYDRALSATEITELARVNAPTNPTLTIVWSGSNVVISWPDVAGFALESTPSLSPASWTPVGTASVVVGDGKTVTLGAAASAAYYRLKK